MKTLFLIIIVLLLSSCGVVESMYDEGNYESMVNETGFLELYSGGECVKRYDNVKIIYTSSDTTAIYFKHNNEMKYWQGDAYFKLK